MLRFEKKIAFKPRFLLLVSLQIETFKDNKSVWTLNENLREIWQSLVACPTLGWNVITGDSHTLFTRLCLNPRMRKKEKEKLTGDSRYR